MTVIYNFDRLIPRIDIKPGDIITGKDWTMVVIDSYLQDIKSEAMTEILYIIGLETINGTLISSVRKRIVF
jgi:hypothetical protein